MRRFWLAVAGLPCSYTLGFFYSLQLCHLIASAVSLWSTGMGGSSRRTRFSTRALSLPHTSPSAFLSISLSLYLCIFLMFHSFSLKHAYYTHKGKSHSTWYVIEQHDSFLNMSISQQSSKWIFSLCFWLGDTACCYCPDVLLSSASVSFVSK